MSKFHIVSRGKQKNLIDRLYYSTKFFGKSKGKEYNKLMRYPNLREEKKLWKKRFKRVACLDEAGRGALAAPVIAAAVLIKPIHEIRGRFGQIRELKDSKKLTPKKREEFYKILIKNSAIEWGIGRVSEKVIDKINILEATKLAMKKAIKKLKRKPDFLILDDLWINGQKINWIDAKNFYGLNTQYLKKRIKHQTKKYLDVWGSGSIIFSLGFSSGLKIPGILFIDYYSLKNNILYQK